MVNDFEVFHGIPHFIRVVVGSHIPILTLVIGGEDYVIKSFFIQISTLLQGVVDIKCVFWDYEFG